MEPSPSTAPDSARATAPPLVARAGVGGAPLASRSAAAPARASVPVRAPARSHVLAAAAVAVLFLLRLAILPWLGLFNDEAYYWEWSRRLAASYYDHPPLVAWILAVSTRLLGHGTLAVHLPALLFTAATSLVLLRLSLDLVPGRRDVAWGAVLLCNAAPLFGLGAVFTTPDAPATFFWILTAWLAWRAVNGAPRLWYAAGLAAGLGLLSKYTDVFLLPGILLFLLLTPHRAWLRRKEPYLALAIAALAFAPVVLWNARHGWESFLFQLVERHGGAFRPWRTVPRFLAAQQSLSPLVWAACLVGLARSGRAARAGSAAAALVFGCAAPSLAFFTVASLFTYVNPNWFGPAFLTLMIPASAALLESRSRLVRLAPAGLGLALSLVFYVQAISLALPLPPRLDFATDLVGWEEVGARLRGLQASGAGARPFVFSRRLQLSALAAFYGGDGLEVTRLGGRRDQYDEWTSPEALRGRDAVYFCDDLKFRAPDELPFQRCEAAGELPIVRHGRTVRRFFFWRCFAYQP
ncbi:ArnT family glycosyltransferase [Anaeromyxobacter soli]|uniref:ArnT family glycosyltransferase n=1 Tax=Anaeromyxobacter soli TaxID=2922725 RepID=UPI001FAFE34F|nr:glycosyltransferase family 39 protein [Anaeromyxobacter sp. SG29]